MEVEEQVQRLIEAEWVDLGSAAGEPTEVVERLAQGPGIYRCRETGSDDPWRFLYVNEDGSATDSGAASRL